MSCEGCHHSLGKHVKNINDEVICTQILFGETSGGFRSTYVKNCDCVNHKSAERTRREERESKKRDDFAAQLQLTVDGIKNLPTESNLIEGFEEELKENNG